MPGRWLGAFALALCALAACVPPEIDTLRRFPEDTPMGDLQRSDRMTVAIDTSFPPFGGRFEGGRRLGFTQEIGDFIATEMGVDAEFVAVTSKDRVVQMVSVGDADLGFAPVQLTESSVRGAIGGGYLLTDPYYIAHQRLLVKTGSGIGDVEDLANKRVCEALDPETGVPIEPLNGEARTSSGTLEGCLRALRRDRVDAVSALDALLFLALEDPNLELVGDELSTVGWGAVTDQDLSGMAPYYNGEFAEAKSEGLWAGWYDEWIGDLTRVDDPIPPELSMEEAAALWPAS